MAFWGGQNMCLVYAPKLSRTPTKLHNWNRVPNWAAPIKCTMEHNLSILFRCGLTRVIIGSIVLDTGMAITTPDCGSAMATGLRPEIQWSWPVRSNLVLLA